MKESSVCARGEKIFEFTVILSIAACCISQMNAKIPMAAAAACVFIMASIAATRIRESVPGSELVLLISNPSHNLKHLNHDLGKIDENKTELNKINHKLTRWIKLTEEANDRERENVNKHKEVRHGRTKQNTSGR